MSSSLPTGDPVWTCPHCGRSYYANVQMSCPCRGAGTTWHTHDFSLPEPSVTEKCSMFADTSIVRQEQVDAITAKGHHDTLVVNLFAGPGAGKSTTAAGIFFELKSRGINCEIATEYAKDLAWEERHQTFQDQIYIFGKQYHRIHRLLGQVRCVITDSPILLTPVYDGEKRETLEKLVVEEHNKMWTYNAFLKRKKEFNPKGRIHGEDEAKTLDLLILDMLDKHNQLYEVFEGTPEGKDQIVRKVLLLLEK